MASHAYDYVIVGAGIVGLSIARELAQPRSGRILVLEKEPAVGKHASGRNSGVVHAGIYYAADSLKARFCAEGAKRLVAYCEEKHLPVLKCGKVIVATKPETVRTLETLLKRAEENGVEAKKISPQELKELEPEARSHGYAIWSPNTAVIDSRMVLEAILQDLKRLNVEVRFNSPVASVDPKYSRLRTAREEFKYGFLFNTAGAHADKIAHMFGVGMKYQILPFKGLYWKASDEYAGKIKRLIYPAPDIRMPFLGVHITRTIDNKVLFGPTAIPAFGRENYSFFGGLSFSDTAKITYHLSRMMINNPGGFRRYAREEISRYFGNNFFNEARTLVHNLKKSDIASFYKVGIRAQLLDMQRGQLEMDFVVEKGQRSMHVLNAISPAFTSAFAMAPFLVNDALKDLPTEDVFTKL